jgi:hypothetical protein
MPLVTWTRFLPHYSDFTTNWVFQAPWAIINIALVNAQLFLGNFLLTICCCAGVLIAKRFIAPSFSVENRLILRLDFSLPGAGKGDWLGMVEMRTGVDVAWRIFDCWMEL